MDIISKETMQQKPYLVEIRFRVQSLYTANYFSPILRLHFHFIHLIFLFVIFNGDCFSMNSFGSWRGGAPARRDKGSTHGAELVLQATEEFLIGPNWSINMEVSDYVNGHGETAATDVAKQLRKRLKSKNPKVLILSLTLLESVVKNCSFSMHAAIASEKFQSRLYAVCFDKNVEVAQKALGLVQQFGNAFQSMSETLPGYLVTWQKLKKQNIIFPSTDSDTAPPVFTPPPSTTTATTSETGAPNNGKRTKQFEKLKADVEEVIEQAKSAKKLLKSHTGQTLSDSILDVLDFWTSLNLVWYK